MKKKNSNCKHYSQRLRKNFFIVDKRFSIFSFTFSMILIIFVKACRNAKKGCLAKLVRILITCFNSSCEIKRVIKDFEKRRFVTSLILFNTCPQERDSDNTWTLWSVLLVGPVNIMMKA